MILTQALLGDSLVADYLLFYLVSTMYVKYLFIVMPRYAIINFTNYIYIYILFRYNRQHNQAPGKLSLNIRGIPISIGKNYTKQLYSLISYLVVKSEYLPITIDNMNNINMVPR